MPRGYQEIPLVEFPSGQAWGPDVAPLFAQTAIEHGPIFRRLVRGEQVSELELLYLVGAEANRMVFHTQREHFSHDLGWTPLIGETLGHGLLNMDPPDHTRHRVLMNPAFASNYIATYLPVMERVIAERTGDWAQRADINLLDESREIAFDVAAASLVSARTGAMVDRLRELFYVLLHGYDGAQHESWELFLERRDRAQEELAGILLQMIVARRASADSGKPTDVLGMIVNARDAEGRALSDEQVLAHVNILLVAGHETTTMLGGWVLYLLTTHPDYLARVQDELDRALGSREAALTVEAIKATPVLGNAVKEAGRLESPVAMLPRGVARPFEFGGYLVPTGTQVRLAIAATHRLPTLFAEPSRFDPDRFVPPRDEERRTPYALATFGGGSRICIGINFAQIEVKALAANVLRRYRLEPLSDVRPQPYSGITAVVPDGIHVHARAR
ncbi:MAG TPA: cytochrome P450 [Chloroflexota bacterium]